MTAAPHAPSPSPSTQPAEVDVARRGAGKARVAYILAASHSGSTLLAMLLGAHPDLCTVGELKATNLGDPNRYRCSCHQPISQCDFWREISARMAAKGLPDFSICDARTSILHIENAYCQRLLSPLHRGAFWEALRDTGLMLSPAWRQHFAETSRRNVALVQSLHEVTGARWVVDSSKIALRLKYLLRQPETEVKILRLIRDGRAVSLTYLNDWAFADASDPALRNGGTGELRPSVRDNMHDAANEWRRSNEASECALQQLPKSQWLELRYEEVCTQPEATLRKICQFLEVDASKINLNFRSRKQHVVGNGMRLDSTSEIRLDERWKTHLSKEDLATFESIAGDLNRKYGYS
jgi:hypothetical protein